MLATLAPAYQTLPRAVVQLLGLQVTGVGFATFCTDAWHSAVPGLVGVQVLP